ncbi:hypothetical protein SUGI_0258570 [Cryptomeria japonica]|uniref:uncharacterized protein LOC131044702 isoform X3 n=1 Tax=Cryptomeria japonica TaxID=3369 RepID=UPI002408AB6F|nr:uncharacterized protein LOC131044702 isoform X3 [Cryptomeria japonica]GLJ15707.1 hypothetical protein SUGI_0258570 [Cryptomeria japonica]
MIQLLTMVVIGEGMVAVLVSLDLPPISKVARSINYASSSRFTAVIGTLAGTMFVILGSSITSIMKIQGRSRELGAVTPTDQILMKTHMLEASLMGYALLLGFLIDRLHYFVRRVDALKKEVKNTRTPLNEEKQKSSSNTTKVLKDEIAELKHKLQTLSLDSESIEKQAKSAEANAKALEEQAQGFLLKYDRLEEDNQKLQSEISALKKTSPNVHSKKDA